MNIANSTTENYALTVKEFCANFRIGRTKFYDLVNSGDIKIAKIGSKSIILRKHVEEFKAKIENKK